MSRQLPFRPLPFFVHGGKIVQCSTTASSDDRGYHFDLLSFISIAQSFGVDFINVTWQPALEALGKGATSTIQQAQIDAQFNLAFKRSIAWTEQQAVDTELQSRDRYRAIIYELIALELLSNHENVIDLIGITWETDGDSEEVWPVLLTERCEHGTLTTFLQSTAGSELTDQGRLDICIHVAKACLAVHALGIVHGDIKAENVLIFGEENTCTAKLIDFGFSCLGSSDTDMVQVACTKPWEAPEHSHDSYFTLADARKMDIYSFGMLVCRMFLQNELSESLIGFGGWTEENMSPSFMERLQHLKRTNEFLPLVQRCLTSSKDLDEKIRSILCQLFEITLQPSKKRAADFSSIMLVLEARERRADQTSTDFKAIDKLSHTVLNIGDLLADLDDTDYLLHRTLVQDLRNRVNRNPRCPCFKNAAVQLSICYEIAFGVSRSPDRAKKFWDLAGVAEPQSSEIIESINKMYDGKRPDRLLRKLGYDTNLAFDPIELYQVQNRLSQAEAAFQMEVQGRKDSMGEQSKSYISQLSTLALLFSVKGDLEEAEKACISAAESSRFAYGEAADETISSQNYLARILSRRGKWAELESLQLQVIPVKMAREDIGPKDTTTLNSQNHLVVSYCFQGKFEQSIQTARELVSFRTTHLGPEHQETLVTTYWLLRSLLESRAFGDLKVRAADLVNSTGKVCGSKSYAMLERKELLAAILLSLSVPENGVVDDENLVDALDLIVEVLDECDVKDSSNLTLFVRSQTSLICILALQGEMDKAKDEIKNSAKEFKAFIEIVGVENVEVKRLKQVAGDLGYVAQSISLSPKLSGPAQDARKRLAHRW